MSAADRREAILSAALEAFSDGPYHETSLELVAERAGISKALIYEHFASKRELHTALLERYVEEMLARVVEAIKAAPVGEERLRAGAEAFFGFVEENRGGWRVLFRNAEDPEVADSLERLRAEAVEAITDIMAADTPGASSDPQLRQSVEMVTRQLTGAVQALATWWDEHREVPRERVVQRVMDFAWLGLERLGRGEGWRGA